MFNFFHPDYSFEWVGNVFLFLCIYCMVLFQSVSELMSVIKGLKVDGVTSDTKKKIGFSAAAEFKKRKLQKIQSPKKTAIERKDASVSKR